MKLKEHATIWLILGGYMAINYVAAVIVSGKWW